MPEISSPSTSAKASKHRTRRERSRRQGTRPSLTTPPAVGWKRWETLAFGLLGGLILWAALPPVQWSWLAWIAPVPWLVLITRPTLSGTRPYLFLWVASSVHWLAVLQGIRLPYWALYFGWAALSLYLAIYLPLFIGITRVAVRQAKWPLWLASPVVWVGLEYARGYVATGFSGALLGHTLVNWIPLIQISDLVGAYGVSFLVMLVAAAGVDSVQRIRAGRRHGAPLLAAAVSLALTCGYGEWRRQQSLTLASSAQDTPVRVALLQGTFDTVFEYNPRRNEEVFEQYLRLAISAARENPELDLIIWPESTFTENNPHWVLSRQLAIPADLGGRSASEYEQLVRRRAEVFAEKASYAADLLHPEGRERRVHQMVGTETVDLTGETPRRYNSALFLDPTGEVVGRYDKIHRVMFGEYIPLGDWFPWIYDFSPMGGGLTSGSGPVAMQVAGLRFVPSICFESFVPHFVRWQLRRLEADRQPPDILVNLTHDGWFWGSSILDLHLTCAIFRAVEHRRPMLAAANPGLTAWVDSDGRVRRGLERHQESYVLAEVNRENRWSLYRWWGDLPVAVCLVLCGIWSFQGVRRRFTGPSQSEPSSQSLPI